MARRTVARGLSKLPNLAVVAFAKGLDDEENDSEGRRVESPIDR